MTVAELIEKLKALPPDAVMVCEAFGDYYVVTEVQQSAPVYLIPDGNGSTYQRAVDDSDDGGARVAAVYVGARMFMGAALDDTGGCGICDDTSGTCEYQEGEVK